MLRQVCGALAEAHVAGLVHRDLKPANIFAARRGHLHDFVKLLDFGLVMRPPEASSTESSREGEIAGSPLYMAPEQATGDARPDARTDLYSLGRRRLLSSDRSSPLRSRDRNGRNDRRGT